MELWKVIYNNSTGACLVLSFLISYIKVKAAGFFPHIQGMRSRLLSETSVYFCFIFIAGILIGALGPSLTHLAAKTNVSISQMSVIFLLLPAGYIIGIISFRYLSSAPIFKQLLIFALLANLLFFPFIAYTQHYLLVCLLFLILAIGRGFMNLTSNVAVTQLHKKNSAAYVNTLHFFFGLGIMVAPVFIGYELEHNSSLIYSYTLFASLALLPLVLLLFIKITPIKSNVQNLVFVNSSHYKKTLWTMHLFFFIYVMFQNSYGAWIFSYLVEDGLMREGQAGLWTSLFWLSFTGFRFLGIFMAIYISPLRIIMAHTVVLIITTQLIILFGDNVSFLFIANIVIGAALSVMFPCMLSYCSSSLNIPPKTVGNLFISALAGGMIGPWILGQLFIIEPALIFYPLLLCAIAIIFLLFYLMKLNKRRG